MQLASRACVKGTGVVVFVLPSWIVLDGGLSYTYRKVAIKPANWLNCRVNGKESLRDMGIYGHGEFLLEAA
jgi:hypothetical protein